jgi:hypothetical protein
MERERPLGITILCIVAFAVGGWHLLLGMFALAYTSSMVMMGALAGFPPEYAPAYARLGNIGWVLVATGAAIALLIAAGGLWVLQRWAYWLAVAGAGISLLVNVLPGFLGTTNGTSAVSALLAAVVLVYLFLPSVRGAFSGPSADMPPQRA